MTYHTVIFDLDGTLLNTLTDIFNSVNYVLKTNKLPTHSIDCIQSFIGNGAYTLIERAVPPNSTQELIDTVYLQYMQHYALHKNDTTAPYNGIYDLLTLLKQKGIKTAVLSNKPDVQTKPLCAELFTGLIDYAKGQTEDMPSKPHPDGVYHVLKQLGSTASETLYVGDSEVDMQTGKNANLYTVGVSWGFRSTKELVAHGADYIINVPSELTKLL